MSTTKTIGHVTFSDVTTQVPTLDRTNLVETATSKEVSGNQVITRQELVLASGDDDHPLTIRMEHRADSSKGPIGNQVYSLRINTYAEETDDTTGDVLWSDNVSGVIAITLPGTNGVVDVADFADLLGLLYSAFHNGVDGTNVPTTTVIDRLRFGQMNIL